MCIRDRKKGTTTAGTFAAGLTTAAITDGDIAAGNLSKDNKVKVFLDTSGGDVDIDTAATTAIGVLTDIVEGDEFVFVKTTSDTNKITFTDADGVTYNFVDRQTEFIRLTWNGTALEM